jgi:glucosyl-dolichyl phosphate glucuronosyltransferase
MRFTVIIATYNRAAQLDDTLHYLARVTTVQPWDVLVVDNSSSDDTPSLVARRARDFPVPLRYLLEPTQGKYAAMNSGIRASRGEIIAATDDDARVAPDWLDRAEAGLLERRCGFVGGPVRPLWDGQPTAWLDQQSAVVQKVIAICDHGPIPREYGVRLGWPLGVNVAYRREVFERAGLFDPSLGRKAGTLRNQAQREWHLRARAAGITGFYLPDMIVDHRVGADRLQKQYFRRWYYWHGISRAKLYWRFGLDPEEPEALQYTQPLPQVAGVPRRLFLKAVRSLRSWAWRSFRGESARAFEYEMWLCFFAGLTSECRRLSHLSFGTASAEDATRRQGADRDDSVSRPAWPAWLAISRPRAARRPVRR